MLFHVVLHLYVGVFKSLSLASFFLTLNSSPRRFHLAEKGRKKERYARLKRQILGREQLANFSLDCISSSSTDTYIYVHTFHILISKETLNMASQNPELRSVIIFT